MPFNIFDWKRFWCSREGKLNLSDDGYLWNPDSEFGSMRNPDVVPFEVMSKFHCLILLGEPGMGKSTAMQSQKVQIDRKIASMSDASLWIDLRAYQTDMRLVHAIFETSVLQTWLTGTHELHLFLDSLDECLLRIDTVAALLSEELAKCPVPRLKLCIACRTAEWPNGLENQLKRLWGENEVKVYELAPLRRTDVVTAANSSGIDAEAFLSEIDKKEIVPLAIKPVTLRFLLNTYRRIGQFPSSQAELYREGCLRLCEESSESRRDAGYIGLLRSEQRLSLAARIAALTIFSQRYAVWTSVDVGEVPSEDIKISELYGGTEEDDVTEKEISEVLATGLFSSRGPHRMGWAHQTYAEFLAASYIVQSNMTTAQIMSLLVHPDDPDGKLVPQLHETAAWLAGMLPEVFRAINKAEPELLLRSDVATADAKDREGLVTTLLKGFENEELHDRHWDMHRQYRKLTHPKLDRQLEPYIRDKSKGVLVRRASIDIAEACELRTLQNVLSNTALDSTEPMPIRVHAAYTVGQIADDETKLNLKPLVFGTVGDDPDDELKGCALRALWPNGIGAKELFLILTPPRSSLIGAYHTFVSRHLRKSLEPAHLPDALSWVAANGPRHQTAYSVRRLMDAILLAGWKYLEFPAVLDAYAKASLSRFKHHEALVEGRPNQSLHDELRADSSKRQKLLAAMVHDQSIVEQDPRKVAYWIWRLATSNDVLWMIDKLRSSYDHHEKQIWSRLIAISLDQRHAEQIDAVLVGCDEEPALAAEFQWLITPVMLGSPVAEKMKTDFLERQKQENYSQERPLLNPLPAERVEKLLEEYEAGNLAAWWRLNMVLTLKPHSTHYREELESDLTVLPGWKAASAETRHRIVECAKTYLHEQDPETSRWLGTNTFYRSAFSGYRALRLLSVENRDFIGSLPAEVWKKWAPVILSYPTSSDNDEESAHLEFVKLAYGFAPNEIIHTLVRLIDKENEGGGFVFINRKVETCWDDQVASALSHKVKDKRLKPENTQVLLKQLLEHGNQEAEMFARSLLALPLPTIGDIEHSRAVLAAATLMRHTKDANWAVVWPIIKTHREFGHDVVSEVARAEGWGNGPGIWLRLSEDELGDLYSWLAQEYSYPEDPPRDAAGIVSKRESIGRWRDRILENLKTKGTVRACEAIRRIQKSLPELTWLKWTLLDAAAMARRKTWEPLRPAEILKLASTPETRLVQNGNQLLDVIIDSLMQLERKLHGETPASPFLWDKHGKAFRPKEERFFCDFVKLHLEDDLKRRGIVINREVQIHRGERTDIHVTAVTKDRTKESYDSTRVIIEAKGCWNQELDTAMETQLCGHYLEDNACQHGLYLVGWFNCSLWDKTDYRKKQAPTISVEEMQRKFDTQAIALSTDARLIRVLVLNAALR